MYVGVKAVKPLPDFRLLITFENAEHRIFDVRPYLGEGVFRELQDVAVFNTVHVSFDAVEWANGADLCPEILHTASVQVEPDSLATT